MSLVSSRRPRVSPGLGCRLQNTKKIDVSGFVADVRVSSSGQAIYYLSKYFSVESRLRYFQLQNIQTTHRCYGWTDICLELIKSYGFIIKYGFSKFCLSLQATAKALVFGLGCRLQMIQKTNRNVPVRFGDRMLFVVSLRPPGQSDILPASQILFTILESRLQIFLNCKYIQTTHRQYTARDRYTSFRTLMQDKSSQSVLKIQIINIVRFQKLLSGSLDSRGRSAVVQPRPGMQARDPASSLLEGLSRISGLVVGYK
ncbi:Hypothetical_protein [Hexamita inflata]|uniref:Hypothetical_protein n=1 Tax=Hexamita inflata TaxID=28002 RepID=A0AA86TIW2_9EUKA|nr:Hypothetical protein HINF_LOCUS2058 [Hexamita inflata]